MLNIDQIKKLKEEATKGPWGFYATYDEEYARVYSAGVDGKPLIANIDDAMIKDADARFIAALPDIADTAIKALERVEELEKEREGRMDNEFKEPFNGL